MNTEQSIVKAGIFVPKKPATEEDIKNIKQKCGECGAQFPVTKFKEHFSECRGRSDSLGLRQDSFEFLLH